MLPSERKSIVRGLTKYLLTPLTALTSQHTDT